MKEKVGTLNPKEIEKHKHLAVLCEKCKERSISNQTYTHACNNFFSKIATRLSISMKTHIISISNGDIFTELM